jgi:hypothetical protein
VSENIDVFESSSVSVTVPEANEFASFFVVLLKADQVPKPATIPIRPSTRPVARSFQSVRRRVAGSVFCISFILPFETGSDPSRRICRIGADDQRGNPRRGDARLLCSVRLASAVAAVVPSGA